MQIQIYQGNDIDLPHANVNVVIDVIRAFTVAHYTFLAGAEEILLANSVESALQIKQRNPDVLLAGEVNGLPIPDFELDNSPAQINKHNLMGKKIVQKTTNGVKAALNALQADEVYVTGFTNAKTTANHIKQKWKPVSSGKVNIIASHPTGEDDLACAHYMKSILEGSGRIHPEEVIQAILKASAAKKFFDPAKTAFNREDLDFCIKELNSPFVMKINQTKTIPTIERVFL